MAVRKIKGSWWVDFRWRGERMRKLSPLNTKGGAQDYETQIRGLLASHGSVKAVIAILKPAKQERATTFAEFAERWRRDSVDGRNKPSECRNKRSALRNHLLPAFGRLPLADVTSEAIERLKSALLQRALTAKTINNYLAILRKCLGTAVEWDALASLPKIRPLKTMPPGFRFLDREETETLLANALDEGWGGMMLAALRTGMRFGELSALRWEDVDLVRGLIHVRRSRYLGQETAPKNYRTRVVPVAADLADVLRSLRTRTVVHVFERGGRPVPWHAASKALARTASLCGIRRLGWHVFRHTFASELAQRGVSIQLIRELLGHSTIQMTLRYAHLTQDALHDAIARLVGNPRPSCLWAADGQPASSERSHAPLVEDSVG
jgi:integrase